MPTLGSILANVRHQLAGVGMFEDTVTELTAPLTASATVVPVDDAAVIGQGVIEIGLELMRVRKEDPASGTLELFTFGRGYKGTTAASHPAGSEVVNNPLVPAGVAAHHVNGVLTELYPLLYAVKEFEGAYTPGSFTLPADAVGVVAVFKRSADNVGWVRSDEWRYEPDSGNGLAVKTAPVNSLVRVVYAARPAQFDLSDPAVLSAAWDTTTGLEDRIADLVALGVAYRMATFIDQAALRSGSAEARADASAKPPGSMSTVTRLLFQQFQARVESEQVLLHQEHPVRVHKQRGL